MKKSIFWDSFFFVFGFNSNPIMAKAKEIARKSVDQRMGDNWESAGITFKESLDKQECLND